MAETVDTIANATDIMADVAISPEPKLPFIALRADNNTDSNTNDEQIAKAKMPSTTVQELSSFETRSDPKSHIIPTTPDPIDEDDSSSSDGDEDDNADGFARLSFADGAYIMNTLELIIGRDMIAWRAAEFFNNIMADEFPVDPFESKTEQQINDTISEKLTKVDLSSMSIPSKQDQKKDVLSGQQNVDLSSLLEVHNNFLVSQPTDPIQTEHCPVLTLHDGKAGDWFGSASNVSRRHAKIYFDSEDSRWYIHVLGRNGLHVNDVLEPVSSVVELFHGSKIVIGKHLFTFELPLDGEESRIGYSFQNSEGKDVQAEYSTDESDESDLLSYHDIIMGGHDDFDDEELRSDILSSDDELEGDDEEEDDEDSESSSDEAEEELSAPIKVKLNMSRAGPTSKSHAQKSQKSIKSQKPEKAGKTVKGQKGQKSLKKNKTGSMRPATGGKTKPPKVSKEAKESKESKASKEDKVEADEDLKTPEKAKNAETAPKPEGSPKEGDTAQVSRESEIVNGEAGVFIAGLPMGAIIPPKKRGPGRPPKNGVLSKRELTAMSKAHKEAEKNGIADPHAAYLILEAKKAEKAAKAAKGEGDADGDDGDKDGGDLKKKTARAARSPSPEMKRSDFSEEQLQRPPENYVVLIYEALLASPGQKMNLQQIYSAIERKYPYFKFSVQTAGWQSSVRHNLGQNPTFKKVEKDGKGWMWGISPGYTLDSIREKKKKATPPPMPPPSNHHNGGGYQYGGHHAHQYSHPNGQVGANGHAYNHGQPMPPRQPIPQNPHNVNGQPLMNGQHVGQSNIVQPGVTRPNNIYSQPYSTANQRPQGSGPHQLQAYGQPPHRPHQTNYGHNQPGSGPVNNQPQRAPTVTPNQQAQQQHKPPPRPSADVIDTFINVFTSSFRDMRYGQEINEAKANSIVKNAVARVLDPKSVSHIPESPEEEAIISAFRKCLQQSQPRQDAGGVPRTYSNYLYPYTSRNQSSVFGNGSQRPTGGNPAAPRYGSASSSSVGIAPATNGPNQAQHPPPPHPGRTIIPAAPASSSRPPTPLSTPVAVAPRVDSPRLVGTLAIQAAAAVVNSTTQVRPPTLAPSPNVAPRPSSIATGAVANIIPANSAAGTNVQETPSVRIPATIPHLAPAPLPPSLAPTTTAATPTSVAQVARSPARASSPTPASPRAPAIEPITPPAISNNGKRTIDQVDEPELGSPEKKQAI